MARGKHDRRRYNIKSVVPALSGAPYKAYNTVYNSTCECAGNQAAKEKLHTQFPQINLAKYEQHG
jgi:hypothetical protein